MRNIQVSKSALTAYLLAILVGKGSQFSGNYGHKGRKGKKGGSLPGGGHTQLGITANTSPEGKDKIINRHKERQAAKKGKAKGPLTAEQVRNKVIALDNAVRDRITKLEAEEQALYRKSSAYSDKHLDPLYEQFEALRQKHGGGGPALREDPEYQALREEIGKHEAVTAQYRNEAKAIRKEIKPYEEGLREATMKLIEVPEEQRAKVQLRTKDPTIERVAQEGLDDFNRLFGRGTMDGTAVTVETYDKSRAGYDPLVLGGTGRIVLYSSGPGILRSTSSKTSMLHEMGHWLEERDKGVFTKARDFLLSRTQKDPAQKMADIKPGAGYADYEITRPDQFADPYVGRAYTDPGAGHYATEIVSMGLEFMYTDPAKFAKDDPGHFDFIYNLMRDRP